MKQKMLKSKILEKLENDMLTNKEYYLNMIENPRWLEKIFKDSNNNNYEVNTQIDVEPFELIIGDSKTDVENAKIVYSHLKELKPVQAVSAELWTYMTHIQFPEYMATRWQIKENPNSEKLKAVIE